MMELLINALKIYGYNGVYLEFVKLLRLDKGFIKIDPEECINLKYITICKTSLVIYDNYCNPEVYDVKTLKQLGVKERAIMAYNGIWLRNGIVVDYAECKYIINGTHYDFNLNEVGRRVFTYNPDQNYKLYNIKSIINGHSEYSIIEANREQYLVKKIIRDVKYGIDINFIYNAVDDNETYYIVAQAEDDDFYLIHAEEKYKLHPCSQCKIKPDPDQTYGGYKIQNTVDELINVFKINNDYVATCGKKNTKLVDLDMRKPNSGIKTKPAIRRTDEDN